MSSIPAPRRVAYSDCPSCGYKDAFSTTVKNGRELFYCHAGCPQDALWRVMREERPFAFRPAPETRQRVNFESLAYVQELWGNSVPSGGTLAELYLHSRGLSGAVPDSVRFLRHHLHKPTGTCWPVMLAAVTDCIGHLKAVHRTYLARDGNGKAPVERTKMTLAPVGGFAIHLALAAEKMAITEGIETGLSIQHVTGIHTWAAISAGGMRQIILPPLPLGAEIIIAADSDSVGMQAAYDVAARFVGEGRRTRIATPPAGMDFNDVLQEAVA